MFSSRLCDEGLSSERIELEVRDNGCGVEQADLARVFDRGFTGENGRSGKRATGIGRYLVKRLCDKMGLAARATAPGEYFAVTIAFPTSRCTTSNDCFVRAQDEPTARRVWGAAQW